MEGSIRTCSFSFLEICIGFKMISGDVLKVSIHITACLESICTLLRLRGCCVVRRLGLRSFRDIMLLLDLLGRS